MTRAAACAAALLIAGSVALAQGLDDSSQPLPPGGFQQPPPPPPPQQPQFPPPPQFPPQQQFPPPQQFPQPGQFPPPEQFPPQQQFPQEQFPQEPFPQDQFPPEEAPMSPDGQGVPPPGTDGVPSPGSEAPSDFQEGTVEQPESQGETDGETKIENPVAEFTGLDKITGRVITFDVLIDETVQFGALQVTPRICYSRPPTEPPQTTVFVEIDEVTLDNRIQRIFSGWMFADSPGLNAVEHPVYDVWLTNCKASSEEVETGSE